MLKLAKIKHTVCIGLLLISLGIEACDANPEKVKRRPPVPVIVAVAEQKEVPVQLKAIGTVEALASVVVKAQVSGMLSEVNFKEGGDVEKGELLARIDSAPFLATLRQHEATLARDSAQEKYARELASRHAGLVHEGIVSPDQYDLLRANADALFAAVASDKAALKSAKIRLDYCTIIAPISGKTGPLLLHAGNVVKENDTPIVVINQIRPIFISFSIPEKNTAAVKSAMAQQTLKVMAILPETAGDAEAGIVDFLDNAINPGTGTIKLKGRFANTTGKLWPGQFTDIILTLSSVKNAIVIPSSAIQTGQEGRFVYIVKPDNTVTVRPVKVGFETEAECVIEEGVEPGETVVTSGQLRLTPGAVIAAKEPSPIEGNLR